VRVPQKILYKEEAEIFQKLNSYESITKTADCKEFTLKIAYRKKSHGRERGNTQTNKYNKIKK